MAGPRPCQRFTRGLALHEPAQALRVEIATAQKPRRRRAPSQGAPRPDGWADDVWERTDRLEMPDQQSRSRSGDRIAERHNDLATLLPPIKATLRARPGATLGDPCRNPRETMGGRPDRLNMADRQSPPTLPCRPTGQSSRHIHSLRSSNLERPWWENWEAMGRVGNWEAMGRRNLSGRRDDPALVRLPFFTPLARPSERRPSATFSMIAGLPPFCHSPASPALGARRRPCVDSRPFARHD